LLSGGYDAGVQPTQPGFPPHWGSSPQDPREHSDPGYAGQSAPAYGTPPPPAPGYPPAGYGQQPGWGGHSTNLNANPISPTTQQTIGWISFAALGLLGLLGAILTLTLWINLSSSVNRAADMCNRVGGEYSSLCRQHIRDVVPSVPVALVVCLFLITAASLAATAGAVLLFVKKQLGQFFMLGGGIVMLVLAIGCEARYGPTGRVTYDLIAGFVIAAVGGLMLIPAFRVTLGMPPRLGGPGPVGSPSGQWPYGQPPPRQDPPGAGGHPPPHW
jgi:hypothetical protein